MKVAICDDEKVFLDCEKRIILQYMEENNIECVIDTFNTGAELLKKEQKITEYNIVFLDINMNEIDGIQAAQYIREYSRQIKIVFVTAYIKYSLDGYKVGASRYLIKHQDNFQETVYECLDDILYDMKLDGDFSFKYNGYPKKVKIKDIVYIESSLHRVIYHVKEDDIVEYSTYDTLDEVEKQINSRRFVRIHQSFLVNLEYVRQVKDYKVVLCNDFELQIPKIRYRSVKDAFIAYKGEL